MKYDVAVLGAGPGGYIAAIRCAQLGLSTVLVEAQALGGTCLNRGCIPTKSLLYCAETYDHIKKASALGISTGVISFDYSKFKSYKDRIVNRLKNSVASLEKAYGVEVVYGRGVLKDRNTILVNDHSIEANNIILATGSVPYRLPFVNENSRLVLTSDEVLSLDSCPEKIVIIGGGVIGLEFATLFSTLGKSVTILEMLPNLLPEADPDITGMLIRKLKSKGVTFFTGAKVTSVTENEDIVTVQYEHEGSCHDVSGDCCILSVGRKPQTQNIGLEALNIEMNRNFVAVDSHLRTSIPHIYAIGDITGKLQLAHVASAQAITAAENCAGHNKSMDYGNIPSCLYTFPEIAYVGLTEQQAKEKGHKVKLGSFGIGGNGKSMILGEKDGIAKLIVDEETDEILGAHIMAPHATDLIAEICTLRRCEGTYRELADTVHPHPTVSEIIMEAAEEIDGACCNAMPKS